MAKTVIGKASAGDGGLAFEGLGRRAVGVFAVVGTLLLAVAISPGLRADLGWLAFSLGGFATVLGGLAALLGGAYAALVEGLILPLGAFAPVAFFLFMIAQVFVAPIPSAPVVLAGAIAFGAPQGFALSLAGSVVGSALVFLAVRRWGEPLVARMVGEGAYRRYAGKLDDRGWWLFAVLLLPFTPDDAMVALAGLSTLGFRRFLVVMVAGRIPATATTALLASDWVTGSTAALATAGLAVVAVLSLGFVYRRRIEGWLSRSTDEEQTSVGSDEASRTEDAR